MLPSVHSNLECLLTHGCDTRIVPDPDGLNRYGCAPAPRDVVPFGSCTCSSPSWRGIKRAGEVLNRLQVADLPELEAKRVCQEHRAKLRELLTLSSDVDVAFTPSGTDAELLALMLVRMKSQRPVVNVIVGPMEVGSGTSLAAAGRHYDTVCPHGDPVTKGMPVCSAIADQVTVRNIEVRDARGVMLDTSLIDATVVQAVAEAVEEGVHAVVHVVAHSKTGVHAPSLECVERISRNLPNDVSVIIDAAQGRVSRRGLRNALAAGHQVIFTGSKFYGGPPFSGALLVPASMQALVTSQDSYLKQPTGISSLGKYLSAIDLPNSWSAVRQWLPEWANYGSILRWSAALAEIEAYYSVPDSGRLAVLRAFERDVPRLFGDSPSIRLLPVFPPATDDAQTRLLESKTTVFAFQVVSDGKTLSHAELQDLHGQLIRGFSSTGEVSVGSGKATRFHLGQPVRFRDGSAALRIALGAELIVRVATDSSLGNTLNARIDWLRSRLRCLSNRLQGLIAVKLDSSAV